jgi:polyhydroxyalkanoate synthesis regulator protein
MEHSIESFSKNQQEIMKQMTDMMSGTTGLNGWAEVSRRNLELFQESFGMMRGGAKAAEEEDAEPVPEGTDLDKLSQQLADMQKQLDALSKKD